MTPLEIRIALHYHYSPEEWSEVYGGSDMSEAIIGMLVKEGLLERKKLDSMHPEQENFRYVATDGLRVYVEALQALPLPTRQWVMP